VNESAHIGPVDLVSIRKLVKSVSSNPSKSNPPIPVPVLFRFFSRSSRLRKAGTDGAWSWTGLAGTTPNGLGGFTEEQETGGNVTFSERRMSESSRSSSTDSKGLTVVAGARAAFAFESPSRAIIASPSAPDSNDPSTFPN